jgi:hypothetical protein
VEINSPSFTKLLQTHTYNILHTSAARQKTFTNERLDSSKAVICARMDHEKNIAVVLQEMEHLIGSIDDAVLCFYGQPTNSRTIKERYELVAPNRRRTLF